MVSIDKATALKMHDKVREHWKSTQEAAEKELVQFNPDFAFESGCGAARCSSESDCESAGSTPSSTVEPFAIACSRKDCGSALLANAISGFKDFKSTHDRARVLELQRMLQILRATDMALIVSPGQNEIPQMQARGLDIEPHRRRMNESQPPLDEKFKDPEDPLLLVFLCAMWLTGFDAPSCSTVYLDKPMRNHTLMQTIARANRVFPGKHSGVIVDYANVFASLEKALAIYGAGKGGKNPVQDKQKLAGRVARSRKGGYPRSIGEADSPEQDSRRFPADLRGTDRVV